MRQLLLIPIAFAALSLSGFTSWGQAALSAQPNRSNKDFAIFFPVNEYESSDFQTLSSSIKNAEDIAYELRTAFGFRTEIFPNATESVITETLYKYEEMFREGTLPEDGQLLIYFSGHGLRDYFMPADADPLRPQEKGISYFNWRRTISQFKCQHILIAVDACFSVTLDPDYPSRASGGFSRPGGELTIAESILANHDAYKARVFFTSDANEDKTPGASNFAKHLLEGLRKVRDEKGFFNASQLFSAHVKSARPSPWAGDFEGDEASSTFLFFHDSIHVEAKLPEQTDLEAWEAALKRDDCTAYRNYLQRFPTGNFSALASTKIAPCDAQDQLVADWDSARNLNTCESYEAFMKEHPLTEFAKVAKVNWRDLGCTPKAVPGKMTYLANGTFKMGDEVVKPEYGALFVHDATITTFYLSATELTNREYVEFLNAKGNQTQAGATWYKLEGQDTGIERSGAKFKVKEGLDDYPVVNVTWYGAVAYCNWLSQQKGYKAVYKISGSSVTADWSATGFRLPTEAEWEYAARSGGVQEEWSGTSSEAELIEFSNFGGSDDGFRKLAPISQFQANAKGLADMSGNATEWCWDWYDEKYYESAPVKHPKGPSSGRARVLRGGSWNHAKMFCRTTQRYSLAPSSTMSNIGFRLARNWSSSIIGNRPAMQTGRKASGGR